MVVCLVVFFNDFLNYIIKKVYSKILIQGNSWTDRDTVSQDVSREHVMPSATWFEHQLLNHASKLLILINSSWQNHHKITKKIIVEARSKNWFSDSNH